MGLAAQYQLVDDLEQALPIPQWRSDRAAADQHEFPLIIQDKLFASDGKFLFDDNGHSGLFGDVKLVNGRP